MYISQSATSPGIAELIEAAAKVAGSQVKLAKLLDTTAPTLIQMKQGKRPANYRMRARMRVVLGEQPAAAFLAAMAEDLAESENAIELEASASILAVLQAFPKDVERAMGIEPTS